MKIRAIFIFLSLIAIIQTSTYASVDKRQQWWNIRLEKLITMRDELDKEKGLDEQILFLADREIERARKILGIFQEKSTGVSSDAAPRRVHALSEMNSMLDREFSPLFSIYTLSQFIKGFGDYRFYTYTESAVKKKLSLMIINSLKKNQKSIDDILKNDIDKSELKVLSAELFLGSILKKMEGSFSKIKKAVSENFVSNRELKKEISDSELSVRISESIITALEKENFIKDPDFHDNIIDTAWSWMQMETEILKKNSGILTDEYRNRWKSALPPEKMYEYRLNRNREYLNFIRDMYRDASTGTFAETISAKNYYNESASGAGRIIKFFRNLQSYNHSVSNDEKNSIERKKVIFENELKKYQSEISGYCRDYLNSRVRISKKNSELMNSCKGIIGQHEINVFMESIHDHIKVYSGYNYGAGVMNEYKALYDRLHNESISGKISKQLKESMSKGSLLGMMPEYKRENFERENSSRIHIKKEAMRIISWMQSVIQFYKKIDAGIRDLPSSDDIDNYKNILNQRVEKKIGQWVMTESNYETIDRNLVKDLSNSMKKTPWLEVHGESDRDRGQRNFLLSLTGLRATFTIPAGWDEKVKDDTAVTGSPSKFFESYDGTSAIEISWVPLKGRNIMDLSEELINRHGAKYYMKKWGKNGFGDYFWVLSKADENVIIETYICSRNEVAFVISGRVSKEKYQFFKSKFDNVFSSLNINI